MNYLNFPAIDISVAARYLSFKKSIAFVFSFAITHIFSQLSRVVEFFQQQLDEKSRQIKVALKNYAKTT